MMRNASRNKTDVMKNNETGGTEVMRYVTETYGKKKRPKKMDMYELVIKEWLLEDKTRQYKQRHTTFAENTLH